MTLFLYPREYLSWTIMSWIFFKVYHPAKAFSNGFPHKIVACPHLLSNWRERPYLNIPDPSKPTRRFGQVPEERDPYKCAPIPQRNNEQNPKDRGLLGERQRISALSISVPNIWRDRVDGRRVPNVVKLGRELRSRQ
jgi:hypothetical protein